MTWKMHTKIICKILFSVKTSFLQTPSSSPMFAMRNLFCVSTAALLARPDWVLRSIIGIYQALVKVLTLCPEVRLTSLKDLKIPIKTPIVVVNEV